MYATPFPRKGDIKVRNDRPETFIIQLRRGSPGDNDLAGKICSWALAPLGLPGYLTAAADVSRICASKLAELVPNGDDVRVLEPDAEVIFERDEEFMNNTFTCYCVFFSKTDNYLYENTVTMHGLFLGDGRWHCTQWWFQHRGADQKFFPLERATAVPVQPHMRESIVESDRQIHTSGSHSGSASDSEPPRGPQFHDTTTYHLEPDEDDWQLERRNGWEQGTIQRLNPALDMDNIPDYYPLVVPSVQSDRQIQASGSQTDSSSASDSDPPPQFHGTTTYHLQPGEDDWQLEKRNGWEQGTIQRLNPALDMDNIPDYYPLVVPVPCG